MATRRLKLASELLTLRKLPGRIILQGQPSKPAPIEPKREPAPECLAFPEKFCKFSWKDSEAGRNQSSLCPFAGPGLAPREDGIVACSYADWPIRAPIFLEYE